MSVPKSASDIQLALWQEAFLLFIGRKGRKRFAKLLKRVTKAHEAQLHRLGESERAVAAEALADMRAQVDVVKRMKP